MCDEAELIWQLITPLKKDWLASFACQKLFFSFSFFFFICTVRCVRPAYDHLRSFLSSRLCWIASSGKAPIRNWWTITWQQPLTVSTHNKTFWSNRVPRHDISPLCQVYFVTDWCPKFFTFFLYYCTPASFCTRERLQLMKNIDILYLCIFCIIYLCIYLLGIFYWIIDTLQTVVINRLFLIMYNYDGL